MPAGAMVPTLASRVTVEAESDSRYAHLVSTRFWSLRLARTLTLLGLIAVLVEVVPARAQSLPPLQLPVHSRLSLMAPTAGSAEVSLLAQLPRVTGLPNRSLLSEQQVRKAEIYRTRVDLHEMNQHLATALKQQGAQYLVSAIQNRLVATMNRKATIETRLQFIQTELRRRMTATGSLR